MTTLKYSRQRESIKEYLAHTKEHPTADMVYMHIKEIYPNISLGTVYRNLNLLVDQGEIIKLSQGTGSDRFDGNTETHFHFICNKCSSVLDLDIAPGALDHINVIAGANFSGEISGHIIHFYGTCPGCIKKS
jgi:Fur family peroxide stress response transcriptional regulator